MVLYNWQKSSLTSQPAWIQWQMNAKCHIFQKPTPHCLQHDLDDTIGRINVNLYRHIWFHNLPGIKHLLTHVKAVVGKNRSGVGWSQCVWWRWWEGVIGGKVGDHRSLSFFQGVFVHWPLQCDIQEVEFCLFVTCMHTSAKSVYNSVLRDGHVDKVGVCLPLTSPQVDWQSVWWLHYFVGIPNKDRSQVSLLWCWRGAGCGLLHGSHWAGSCCLKIEHTHWHAWWC